MRFITGILALSIFLSFGCNNGSGSSSGGGSRGTSDSGGGNGIDDKVYEAYIVHVEELPAYKNIILPKVLKLMSFVDKPEMFMPVFNKTLLYKTWYVAPVELNTISKDVIGVSFSSDKTQQLAIQTKKSIWINDNQFRRMSEQDQAALILHEMVMSLYYLKYKSFDETCTDGFWSPEMCSDPKSNEFLRDIFPTTTPKPFDSDDYENIRTVTGVFLSPIVFKNAVEVDDVLIRNHFDKRFTLTMGFKGLPGSEQTEQIIYSPDFPIPAAELEKVLQAAELLNRSPNTCHAKNTKEEFKCNWYMRTVEQTDNNRIVIPWLVFSVGSARTKEFESAFPLLQQFQIHAGAKEVVSLKKKFTLIPIGQRRPTPAVPGTKFRSSVIVTLQDTSVANSPIQFLGVVSVPGVILSADPSSTEGCTFAKPSPKNADSDVLMVYSNALAQEEKNFLFANSSYLSPFTTCK